MEETVLKYVIEDKKAALLILPLMKYKEYVKIVRPATLGEKLKIFLEGTEEQLQPIFKICEQFSIVPTQIFEENNEEVAE